MLGEDVIISGIMIISKSVLVAFFWCFEASVLSSGILRNNEGWDEFFFLFSWVSPAIINGVLSVKESVVLIHRLDSIGNSLVFNCFHTLIVSILMSSWVWICVLWIIEGVILM